MSLKVPGTGFLINLSSHLSHAYFEALLCHLPPTIPVFMRFAESLEGEAAGWKPILGPLIPGLHTSAQFSVLLDEDQGWQGQYLHTVPEASVQNPTEPILLCFPSAEHILVSLS